MLLAACELISAGCSSSNASPPASTESDAASDATIGAEDAGTGAYTETTLTLELALASSIVVSDAGGEAGKAGARDSGSEAGEPSDAEASDGGSGEGDAEANDGSSEAGNTPPSDAGGEAGAVTVSTLTITARDGVTPVVTDLWLYTIDGQGNQTPLTGFTSSQARKSPRLMLPATIKGQSSGLSPADNGNENGTMSYAGNRGVLNQGAFVSTVTGTVAVTLPGTPTTSILVVAGVEDQRYAGAAVINPDGSPGTVPGGVGVPETHTRVSFTKDVAPILKAQCSTCHTGQGPMSNAGSGVGTGYNANFYAVVGTADELVNANFALNEQTLSCETANPDGGLALAACVQKITQAQFLVEPGAPAVSDLLQRSRPDENAGTSPIGLLWYGSKNQRYSTKYGDRRMPSTTQATSADSGAWENAPCYFDLNPAQFQPIYDWVAQGAVSN